MKFVIVAFFLISATTSTFKISSKEDLIKRFGERDSLPRTVYCDQCLEERQNINRTDWVGSQWPGLSGTTTNTSPPTPTRIQPRPWWCGWYLTMLGGCWGSQVKSEQFSQKWTLSSGFWRSEESVPHWTQFSLTICKCWEWPGHQKYLDISASTVCFASLYLFLYH